MEVNSTGAEVQSLSDIQNYLAHFNKEISDGSSITTLPSDQILVQNTDNDFELHQTMIASGSNADMSSSLIPAQLDNTVILQGGRIPTHQLVQTVGSQDTYQSVINPQQTEGNVVGQESMMLNTGGAYQTVTIVPTSQVNNSGEVSYVLVVSPPDEDKITDLSVYDFKEDKGEMAEEDDVDLKPNDLRRFHTRPSHPLMCNYCNYTSPKRYLLTRHMKTHSEERPHKCNVCNRGFKTIASLQNHVNTHTGVKPHKCKECDATFTTSGELVRHVRYRHTFEKPHKCTECDYASVELSKLKRHIRSHTGERPYKCPHCSYSSPDTFKLKRHLRIHTGEKPYKCDLCDSRFTQSNSLKAHRMIHTGEKPVYQCELCPTTCGRKTDLKIHVQKLHTSEHPILCKKCGKLYPDRYTYKLHVKSHDGEKCFRCELCPYAALSQRHLESHILTHTGEKPFQCDECDLTFRQKQLLRRHKNIYHTLGYIPPLPKEKQHKCHICNKSFAHHGNLMRHMISHDPNNPFYQSSVLALREEEEEEEEEEEDDVTPGGVAVTIVSESATTDSQSSHNDNVDLQNNRQLQMRLVEKDGARREQGQLYVSHQGQVYTLKIEEESSSGNATSSNIEHPQEYSKSVFTVDSVNYSS